MHFGVDATWRPVKALSPVCPSDRRPREAYVRAGKVFLNQAAFFFAEHTGSITLARDELTAISLGLTAILAFEPNGRG